MGDLNRAQHGSSGGPKWLAAMSIPMMLLMLPGLGGYVGSAVDRHWEIFPWGILTGVLLGLVLAAVRIRHLLTQLSEETGKEADSGKQEK